MYKSGVVQGETTRG
jgi:hypothetical protein